MHSSDLTPRRPPAPKRLPTAFVATGLLGTLSGCGPIVPSGPCAPGCSPDLLPDGGYGRHDEIGGDGGIICYC